MKTLSYLLILASVTLAACSNDESPVAAVPAAATENLPGEDPQAEVPASEPDDGQPAQMVEESAADEEPQEVEDKPIILAQAEVPAASQDWKFEEGKHYAKMVPTQPTVGGADKVEVAEIFWYGCAHCYTFEPFINKWAEDVPANARLVRIPATWNPLVKLHAQLYYTEEVLGKNGKIADPEQFRNAVFAEYHRRGNRLASMDAIEELFTKHGVSADDFNTTWSSFEVSQKLRIADDLQRRYGITSVPAVVVNGKYRTGAADTGGYPELLELVDELIERESDR